MSESNTLLNFSVQIFDPVNNTFRVLKHAELDKFKFFRHGVAVMISAASFPQCDMNGRLDQNM